MSRLAKWGLLVLMFLLLLSHRLIEERLRPSPSPQTQATAAPTDTALTSTAETDASGAALVPLPPEQQVWTVRSGDTLEKISLELWGSRQLWRSLFEANRDRMSDPGRLSVGMELRVPERPDEGL